MKSVVPVLAVAAAIAVLAAAVQAAGPGRVGNVYYEDLFTNTNCVGSLFFCQNYSNTPTPTDAYVRVKHVACEISIQNNGVLYRAQLQAWNGPPASNSSLILKQFAVGIPTQSLATGSLNYYTIDSETNFLAGPGRYLVLNLQGSGGAITSSGVCGITGDLVPPQ
ncbi:MAG: hypothetical protein JOZ16_18745 [Methylobacteriaceae bacterium]|nr:hypothetical protein [Methylobacteriaceae bacterium]